MQLTLTLIAHELEQRYGSVRADNEHVHILHGVRPYVKGFATDTACLYICDPNNLPPEEDHYQGIFAYVGTNDMRQDTFALIVYTNEAPTSVLSAIQDIFDRYQRWREDTLEAIATSRNLQALTDLAADFFPGPIVMVDGLLTAIARHPHVGEDDFVSSEIERRVNPDNVHLRASVLHMERLQTVSGQTVWIQYDEKTGTDTLRGAIRLEGLPPLIVATCGVNPEDKAWAIDVFSIFLGFVRFCLRRQLVIKDVPFAAYREFFRGIVEGVPHTEKSLMDAATRLNISPTGPYCLFCLKPKNDQKPKNSNYIWDLSARIAPMLAAPWNDDEILILCSNCAYCGGKAACNTDLCMYKHGSCKLFIADIAERDEMYCGLSSQFQSLEQLSVALEQAERALAVAVNTSMSGFHQVWERQGFVEYDSAFGFDVIQNLGTGCARRLDASSMVKLIRRMAQDDRERNTDNLFFLETYLLLERRATQVADALHMHRNNVSRRYEKICRIYEIDLDNPKYREQFLLAFFMCRAGLADM